VNETLYRIEEKIDKLDDKLDAHLERLSKAETHIEHLRGHLKVSTTIFMSIVGVLALSYWDKLVILLLNLPSP